MCPAEENANYGRLRPINARKNSERTDIRINRGVLQGILPNIRTPRDLDALSFAQLKYLAAEIRELIVRTVSQNGGHLASNLGVVELTLVLHRVFDSPNDKIVWDVGHQCYAHKILTGRYELFSSIRKTGGISGFPKLSESPHDSFNTGHASTSISASLGILAAEKLLKSGNRSAAVIGDGALTGGLAYEALSHAGQLGLPLVVILNDNKMSIGPNVGGLSKYLSRLSMKAKYQKFRRIFDMLVQEIPFFGNILFKIVQRLKRAIKAIFYTNNFFVNLGFEYVGPIEGHNIPVLSQVLRDAKNLNKPVVVHVITRKGKGYAFAEKDPKAYHGVTAFQTNTPVVDQKERSFSRVFGEKLLEITRRDERLVAISAAMEEGTGLSPFKQAFPGRFFDVGIAEEHAVTFAAGLASRNLRPIVAVYSTFLQRAVDQVIHDVCLQNLPVIFAVDRAGLISGDGETHQGIYDISLFRSAPNITIFAPAGEEELALILQWALVNSGPLIIRYPKALCPAADAAFSLPLETGKGVWIRRNNASLCLMFSGGLYSQALEAADILGSKGIDVDLYNLRFLKPVDEDHLMAVINSYKYVIFAEEGCISGGFGEYVSALALRRSSSCRLTILGVKELFDAQGEREELLRRNGLDAKSIAKTALDILTPAA